MAKNKHSKIGCPRTLPFDRELKKKYLPSFSIPQVTIIRGIMEEEETSSEEGIITDSMMQKIVQKLSPIVEQYSDTEKENLVNKYGNPLDIASIMKNINSKIVAKESLSSFDNAFMEAWAQVVKDFIKEESHKDLVQKAMKEAGVQTESPAIMYNTFKSKIPSKYRREVVSQICSAFIEMLNKAEKRPEYKNYSREEIINIFHLKGLPVSGFNALMFQTRRFLEFSYNRLKTLSADPTSEVEVTQEQEDLIQTILTDDEAWSACVYMTKNLLLEAEKIKIGNTVDYVENYEEESNDNDEEAREDRDAETFGPEHWQLKVDTISSFNSMSREARSILFTISSGKLGVLGLPDIADVMYLHEDLMGIRSSKFCQDSSDFIDIIGSINEPWAASLHEIMSTDTRKRTLIFNTYNKALTHYCDHRKDSRKDNATRRRSFFYRNSNQRNIRVLMGAYRAGVLDVDPNNRNCLFTPEGTINLENANRVKRQFLNNGPSVNGVSFFNEGDRVYDMRLWGSSSLEPLDDTTFKERARDFVFTVDKILNLKLFEEDVDQITNDEVNFRSFCIGVHKVMNLLLKNTANTQNIDQYLQGKQKKLFQYLIRASKHSVSKQAHASPTEKSYRYKKSTYMAHTTPNHLKDTLERLGRAASKGVVEFRKFLEETYLNCPIYATKTDEGYDIHHYWLEVMYNATDKELKDPNSFVQRFIQDVRGLGTDELEFEKFSPGDNYIFCLNELLQTKRDSNGKFGNFPLFVTGDSNSTRFLTCPMLSNDQIYSRMSTVVEQEIQRMKMFNSIINFLDNPENIPSDSPEYANRKQLKLSDGHAGKTISEWLEEPEEKRPSILRNKDTFTFLPFLNQHKQEILSLYNNRETPEGTIAFKSRIKELVAEGLEELYKKQVDKWKDLGIAEEFGNHHILNDSKVSILDASGKGFINTSTDFELLKNTYLNNKYHLIMQLQFFTVDPGFYKGTDDFQKRYKEMIAAGDRLDLEAIDPEDPSCANKVDDKNGIQHVRYFDEITKDLDASNEEGGSEEDRAFMQTLRNNMFPEDSVGNQNTGKKGKYNKNTLTDGQGYRSFTSYRKLMIMRGYNYWTPQHEEVYQIIKKNREEGRTRLKREDLERILELGVVFQPLKPFYYEYERLPIEGGSEALIPVQHKYSEFPVIPELLPEGSVLGELGRFMEDDGTDLVCCTTCVKVGGFGSSKIDNCKNTNDFKEAFSSGYKHSLSLKGWRQQSNVPEHFDTYRPVGTQFVKNGYGNMAFSENKHYGFIQRIFKNGKIRLTKDIVIDVRDGLNLNNLIQLYGALGSSHFMHASNKLVEQIENPRKVSQILAELRANDAKGAKDSILAYSTDDEGQFLMSPAEGMMAVDNMASLLSKLKKEGVRRPMKGGSAVQVSAFGFEDILKVHVEKGSTSKSNIIYADCAIPFAFSYEDENGNIVDLSSRFLEFVDYSTGMLLDEEGNPVEPAEPIVGELGKEFYGWNTKLGELLPGGLDMIAYRIPNEKAYSILNLKAKRFFPKTMGGIIMVPSQFTTIAGFDFDIDKLYFIRREHKYNKKKDVSNYDIWTDYYLNTEVGQKIEPFLAEALENAINGVEGFDYLGKDKNDYWNIALDMMTKQGLDVSKIPETDSEAFEQYRNEHLSEYCDLAKEYDDNATILENSQAAVNNLFFAFMQARLEDHDTFEERYTPGGAQLLKDVKPIMMAIRYAISEGKGDKLVALVNSENPLEDLKELAEEFKDYAPNYDPTELSTIVHYQVNNVISDNCISVSAIQNINQRLTGLLSLLELKKPIKFGSLLGSVDRGAGKDIVARKINNSDTELLTTNYLAAAVDGVKEAIIEYFGLDDRSLSMGCLLSRIGCTALDIGLLFNQPVVVRASEIMKDSKGFKSFSNALNDALQELVGDDSNLLKEMKEFTSSFKKEGVRDFYVNTDNLVKYIGMNASPVYAGKLENFLKGQFAVVHLLNEIQEASQELSEQVSITQSTSQKSVKSSIGSMESVIQKAKRFAITFGGPTSKFNVKLPAQLSFIIDPNQTFDKSNSEEVLGRYIDSPYCIEQIAYSMILNFINSLEDYFPYTSEGFMSMADSLSALTKRGYLSSEMFDIHNKAAMMFFLERMTDTFKESTTAKLSDLNGDIIDTNIPNRVFYKYRFPQYLKLILNKNKEAFKNGKSDILYTDIPILGSIFIEMENYDKGGEEALVLKMEGIGGLQGWQKDNLLDSWEAMFYSKDPLLKDLALHLFMYSYFVRGFEFGPTTFMSLAPLAVKMAIGDGEYREFYNRVFNLKKASIGMLQEEGGLSSELSIKDYCKAFILNNKDKFYQFTKKLYAETFGGVEEIKDSPYRIATANMKEDKSSFTVTVGVDSDNNLLHNVASPIKINDKVVGYKFTPLIEIDGGVYICDNAVDSRTNTDFNVIMGSGTMTYYKMDVPKTIDYSTPGLFGTEDQNLSSLGVEGLVEIAKRISEQFASLQREPLDNSDAENNTNDSMLNEEDIDPSQYEHPLSPLLNFAQQLYTDISRSVASQLFSWSTDQFIEFKSFQDAYNNLLVQIQSGIEGMDIALNEGSTFSSIVNAFENSNLLDKIEKYGISKDITRENFNQAADLSYYLMNESYRGTYKSVALLAEEASASEEAQEQNLCE